MKYAERRPGELSGARQGGGGGREPVLVREPLHSEQERTPRDRRRKASGTMGGEARRGRWRRAQDQVGRFTL